MVKMIFDRATFHNFLLLVSGYYSIGWKNEWAYKFRSLLNAGSSVILLLFQFMLWSYLSTENNKIQDYSSYFVIMYILNLIYTTEADLSLSRSIVKGSIIHDFLKPRNVIFYIPWECFGRNVARLLIAGFPILIIAMFFSRLVFKFSDLILCFPLVLCSFVFVVALDLIFGLMCFYTQNYWGVLSAKSLVFLLLTGRLLPFEFYPSWLEKVIVKNPLAHAYYNAANTIRGSYSYENIIGLYIEQGFYTVLTIIVLIFIWKVSLNRLSLHGSIHGG